MRAKVWTE